MPTAENIIKDEAFRKAKTQEQLADLERFIKSGKERPLTERQNEQADHKK